MSEDYQGFELQEQMWADLFSRVADDHKAFAKGWAERGDYAMANRCAIIAETYSNVANQMTKSRRIRLEDKRW